MDKDNFIRLKDFLNQFLIQTKVLKQKKYRLDSLLAKQNIKAVSYDQEKVAPTYKISDPFKLSDDAIDLYNEIKDLESAVERKKAHLLKMFNKLYSQRMKYILISFYLKNISLSEIADNLDLPIRDVKSIRQQALEVLSDKFDYII